MRVAFQPSSIFESFLWNLQFNTHIQGIINHLGRENIIMAWDKSPGLNINRHEKTNDIHMKYKIYSGIEKAKTTSNIITN